VLARRLLATLTAGVLLGLLPGLATPPLVQAQPSMTLTASAGWLDRLNLWRTSLGLPTLSDNSVWSDGDQKHSVYMVKNDQVAHSETPGAPYYTTAGDTAARNSNIFVSSTTSTTDEQAIDWWMQAPFHAIGMMDPRLSQTGFGSYREAKSGWQMGASLDTIHGNSFTGGRYPVYFPGAGSTEPLRTFAGGESPDPLQACPGYAVPTGLPVFVQVGGNVATSAGSVHSFVGNGVPLEHCVIDSNNPSVGSHLVARGGVILIPRQPLQDGVTYTVSLTVNGSPYTWSFSVGSLAATPTCRSVTATAAPASAAVKGAAVTIGGVASGCPNPRYRFWVQPPGGAWSIAQDYGVSTTLNWTAPATVGLYRLEVDARDQSSAAAYDSVTNFNYAVTDQPCATASLSPSAASPGPPGAQVTWTGSSTGCPNPRYRFWEQDPGGRWSIVQDYGSSNTFAWNSPALGGSYRFEVDARDATEYTTYDVVANQTFVIQARPSCTSPTLTAGPTSPAPTGATVTLTGGSAGCPNPQYRFWVQAPGGPWTIKQDYGSAGTFSWSGSGLAGSYRFEVDVREQTEGTSVSYDSVSNITYVVAGCSAAGLNAGQSNTAPSGSAVTLAANATCLGTPTFKFWIRAPGGAWTVVRAYSSANTFVWTPSAPGSYNLEVDVRNQGGTDSYEKVVNLTFVAT
jgi:hypothetical protein